MTVEVGRSFKKCFLRVFTFLLMEHHMLLDISTGWLTFHEAFQ